MERPTKEELMALINKYSLAYYAHGIAACSQNDLAGPYSACQDIAMKLSEALDALYAEVPTDAS